MPTWVQPTRILVALVVEAGDDEPPLAPPSDESGIPPDPTGDASTTASETGGADASDEAGDDGGADGQDPLKLDVAQSDDGGSDTATGGDTSNPPWLLHFTRGSPWTILHIDVETGAQTELCTVTGTEGEEDVTSSTFTRDDRLMVSNKHALWEVSLPDCVGTKKADYPVSASLINGISPDAGFGLLGTSGTHDELVALDPDTGEVTVIGSLAFLTFFLSWFAPMRLLPMPASHANTISLISSSSDCVIQPSPSRAPDPNGSEVCRRDLDDHRRETK